jgi:hypothetical protein
MGWVCKIIDGKPEARLKEAGAIVTAAKRQLFSQPADVFMNVEQAFHLFINERETRSPFVLIDLEAGMRCSW